MPAIAERVKIPASATIGMICRVNDLKRKGIDIISLGAGEPGYVTPAHIREFAKKALDDGYTHYSPSAVAQALRDDRSREFIKMMVSRYERRRDIIVQELEKIDAISCVKHRGAFYAFPNISSIAKDSTVLANSLLEKGKVATIPGIVFGRCGESHLRITFTNPDHELREAIRRIGEALKEYTSKT